MSQVSIEKKAITATKWSALAEILSKIITPITNMILARILAPEAFGILATITMVISFAEIFVESGFQKFLIQHIFADDKEEKQFMSVAFWSNLFFSGFLWLIISVFSSPIAKFAGNEGLGYLLIITGVTIPLYGIIGIQNCKLKKELDFKKIFYVRVITAFIPLVITVPLALIGLDYWSLIIGNIAGVVARSITLAIVGKYKPRLYFSIKKLINMLRYGVWTLLDGLAVWATNWIDSLLIVRFMDEYYLGLYKNSLSVITSIFAIVISAVTPVLFSSLSKLQNDKEKFNKMFLSTQKIVCTFILPLGVGLFFYRSLATNILFGSAWYEATHIVGIMSLTTAIRTVFISFYGDAYRAKGKFFIPLILQLVGLGVLIPSCILSAKQGFWSLVSTRAFLKLDLIIPEMILVWVICKITPLDTLKSLLPSLVSTSVMIGLIFLLKLVSGAIWWEIISIALCVIVYFTVLFMFKYEREKFLKPLIKKFTRNKSKDNIGDEGKKSF